MCVLLLGKHFTCVVLRAPKPTPSFRQLPLEIQIFLLGSYLDPFRRAAAGELADAEVHVERQAKGLGSKVKTSAVMAEEGFVG